MDPGWQYYWNPWYRERHVYRVGLGVADCRNRLKAGTRLRRHGPVARLRFTRGLRLRRRTSFFTRSGLRPCAHVRFRRAPEGTEVEVTIGLRPSARGFLTLWFGFAALGTFAPLIASTSWVDRGGVLAAGIGISCVGLVACAYWRLLARKDPEILLAYIEGQLQP